MQIFKEYIPTRDGAIHAYRIVIRTNTYGHNLDYFNTLFLEAVKDFPELKPEDVDVVQFGGIRYKRTMGIEFGVDSITDNYTKVSALEDIL